MHYRTLSEVPHHVDQIAHWYLDEWGYLKEEATLDTERRYVREYLNADSVPMILCALDGDELAAVAQLKFHEMPQCPQFEHWLGGVFVAPEYRGEQVASTLVTEILVYARDFGIEQLYLQTLSLTGGLYAQLGWEPLEQITNKGDQVLVMVNRLIE